MRKEVLFAIITGAMLGLIVAFGIWRANGVIKNGAPLANSTSSPRALTTPPPTPRDATGQLTLLSPLNQEVIIGDSVTITGTTKSMAWIVARSTANAEIARADQNGAFSLAMPIKTGVSLIGVTAFDQSGQAYETEVRVVSTSALTQATNKTPAPQGTDSAQAKAQEKLTQVSNKPSALIGTVTDKTDTGLQIKSAQGEIEQASVVASNIEVVRLGSPNKTLQYADVAIGDYIVAIGYNGSKVLDTKRIYVTSSPSANSKAVYGTVSRISKKDLDIKSGSAEFTTVASSTDLDIYLVAADAKTTTKKFSDIVMGDVIIKADTTIYIVSTSAKPTATPKATSKATPKASPAQ